MSPILKVFTAILLLSTQILGISPAKILSFGGNGFIGSETIAYLLDKGHEVTLVSRGNSYYDSEQRIKPRVKSFKCDRYANCGSRFAGRCEALEKCEDLMAFIDETEKFDYVLDFSAYQPQVVKNALRVLKDKVGLYIYISTDSVYEVSEDAEHDGPSLEGDAVRPDDVDASQQLADQDSYGSEKLAGEELLKSYRETSGGPPYVFLRLPDVIGPRDTTYRSWLYYMRLAYYDEIDEPIKVPIDHASLETSAVFVGDVPKAVEAVMNAGPKVEDQAYNIALKETFNTVRFLHEMGTMMGVQRVKTMVDPDDVPSLGFPSVSRGPVSTVKAQRELKFQPTSMTKAMEETIKFYKDALVKFEKERTSVIDVFLDMFPESKHDDIMEVIDKDLANNGVILNREEL